MPGIIFYAQFLFLITVTLALMRGVSFFYGTFEHLESIHSTSIPKYVIN